MQATTRAAILRSTPTEDTLGDEVEGEASPVAGLDDFPAAITEKTRAVFDPASGEVRTIRYYVGRVPSKVTLEPGDRLKDNRTGRIYTIEEDERTPRSISGRSSFTLDLKLTGE